MAIDYVSYISGSNKKNRSQSDLVKKHSEDGPDKPLLDIHPTSDGTKRGSSDTSDQKSVSQQHCLSVSPNFLQVDSDDGMLMRSHSFSGSEREKHKPSLTEKYQAESRASDGDSRKSSSITSNSKSVTESKVCQIAVDTLKEIIPFMGPILTGRYIANQALRLLPSGYVWSDTTDTYLRSGNGKEPIKFGYLIDLLAYICRIYGPCVLFQQYVPAIISSVSVDI